MLILKELRYRKLNAVLSLAAVVAAVTLFVAFYSAGEASLRETTRVTRDTGFNLRIIPKETDMERFWIEGFSDLTMPEDALERFARYDRVFLTYNHLVGSLQQRYVLGGREVILTGLSHTLTAPAQRKQPLGFQIPAGHAIVGFEVARRLGLSAGDSLTLGSERFVVDRCLAESGTDDDLRVFGLLSDVQRVLGKPGLINEIKAIDCLCLTAEQDPLGQLRRELAKALPEAKVIQLRALADARARQRQSGERFFAWLIPFLLAGCAVGVGVLAVLNVRERRLEIGILRALGHGSARVAWLFLGKAVVLGLAGAILGYALGTWLAFRVGPSLFPVTASSIRADAGLLLAVLAGAPVLTALASVIPAVLAVIQDPAETLRES